MQRTLTHFVGALLLVFMAAPAWGQAFEDLTDTDFTLADGTGIQSAGVGTLDTGGGTINIDIPGDVEQVLIYWGGRAADGAQDDDIVVDDVDVDGTLVGTAGVAGVGNKAFTFGADITALGVVSTGANSIDISGFEDPNPGTGDFRADGVSMVVIYSEAGQENQQFFLRDGADLAYVGFGGASAITNLQTFTFDPSPESRSAKLINAAGDTNVGRGDRLTVWVDGVEVINDFNYFQAAAGLQWSNREEFITIPAGATTVSVQIFSEKFDPADPNNSAESITWILSSLAVPPLPPPDEPGCTYTQGYWKNHSEKGPAPYDNTWAELSNGADTPFFETGLTWLEMFRTPPKKGNAYIQLAHQWMAATLNVLGGADDSAVADELAEAEALLAEYDDNGEWNDPKSLKKDEPTDFKRMNELAGTLDAYNNGEIGPGHCDDGGDSAEAASASARGEATAAVTAYPNPFAGQTTVEVTVTESTPVRAAVYDLMGRRVAVLADETFDVGTHRLPFDASALANGVYLYRVEMGDTIETGRLNVIR